MKTFKTLSDQDLLEVEERWKNRRDRIAKDLWECHDHLMQIHVEKSVRGWYIKAHEEWLEEFKKDMGKED